MRFTLLMLLAALLAACAAAPPDEPPPHTPSPLPTPEPARSELIEFESLTFPGHLWTPFMPPLEQGEPVTINGMLSLPPRNTNEQLPAVIITHGCGGISSGETAWVSRLNRLGIATFMVRSFAMRLIPEVCTGRATVNIASMLTDAYRALAILAADPRIDPTRIAIMGLSFGGRTALWVSHQRFRERYGIGSAQFAAYLAFYPASCYIQLADETAISGGAIRIFHGAADDWTPIGQCKEYIARLQSAGKDADLFEYAGALHSFDDLHTPQRMLPDVLSPRNCTFIEQNGKIIDTATGLEATIDAACVVRGASIGYNAEARQKAVQDVSTFLTTIFRLN